MQNLSERCRRICGGSGEDCFIRNQNQISCIADIVINKVSGIQATLELAFEENKGGESVQFLEGALKNIKELINWVKFLQIAHDLRLPSSVLLEAREVEARDETRYPLPEIYHNYVALKINISGSLRPVLLINFSQRGMQFKCSEPLDIGSVTNGILHTTHTIKKEVPFKVRVKWCVKQKEGYMVGCKFEEISDSTSLNFFKNVYDFIWEALMKAGATEHKKDFGDVKE